MKKYNACRRHGAIHREDCTGCRITKLENEKEELEKKLILKTAEAEAAASAMLDLQQECIALRTGLRIQNQSKEDDGCKFDNEYTLSDCRKVHISCARHGYFRCAMCMSEYNTRISSLMCCR